PLLAISDEGEERQLSRALEMGVNDFVSRPIETNELIARCKTQLRRRRYSDYLRESVQNTMELAVKDALTGLYNRRYLETHLASHVNIAHDKGTPLSLLILDIDHFKQVNDTYGHDAGDLILKEFAIRMSDNVRRIDLPCRMGGEEFVVIMPETDRDLAYSVAERIRDVVAAKPFVTGENGEEIVVTTSIGISCYVDENDTPESMMKRADVALYQAKHAGRNRVVFEVNAA
ncbi:MAG: diguanylate cyclase, partial [Hyphomicrobiales bacterium]